MREEASPHVDALEFEKGREAGGNFTVFTEFLRGERYRNAMVDQCSPEVLPCVRLSSIGANPFPDKIIIPFPEGSK